jgi:hypothetical protein
LAEAVGNIEYGDGGSEITRDIGQLIRDARTVEIKHRAMGQQH